MDEQAVKVIEPAFIKDTPVCLDDIRSVKSIHFLLSAFANKITFTNCQGYR